GGSAAAGAAGATTATSRSRRNRAGATRTTNLTRECPCAGPGSAHEPALQQELGQLHGVRRRPLAQVVRDHPHVEAALVRRVAANAADEDIVPPSCLDRHRIAHCRWVVDADNTSKR